MKSATWSFHGDAVRSAVERVVARLDDPLDLEDLAREVALSPFHFHRSFRGMVGETPLQLQRRLRLERAAWALAQGTQSVTKIAMEARYARHETFTRAFAARYGCTPSAFRDAVCGTRDERELRRQIELPSRGGVHYHDAPLTARVAVLLHQALVDHLGAVAGLDPLQDFGVMDRGQERPALGPHLRPSLRLGGPRTRLRVGGRFGTL